MYRIAICDDRTEWLNEIEEKTLGVMGGNCSIHKFCSAAELIEYTENNAVDILISDISMPEKDGIEMAAFLQKKGRHMQIIFVTAYDYIEDVFRVRPVYYLKKPISEERIREALGIAVRNITERKYITVINEKKNFRIYADEIIYLESIKRKVEIHTENGIYESISKLDVLSDELPSSFVRSHKSFIVNMNRIKRISNNQIETTDNTVLPVPKAKYREVKEQILSYWKMTEI